MPELSCNHCKSSSVPRSSEFIVSVKHSFSVATNLVQLHKSLAKTIDLVAVDYSRRLPLAAVAEESRAPRSSAVMHCQQFRAARNILEEHTVRALNQAVHNGAGCVAHLLVADGESRLDKDRGSRGGSSGTFGLFSKRALRRYLRLVGRLARRGRGLVLHLDGLTTGRFVLGRQPAAPYGYSGGTALAYRLSSVGTTPYSVLAWGEQAARITRIDNLNSSVPAEETISFNSQPCTHLHPQTSKILFHYSVLCTAVRIKLR